MVSLWTIDVAEDMRCLEVLNQSAPCPWLLWMDVVV
jgi:hypothetical protein